MALDGVFPRDMVGVRFEETTTTAKFPLGTVCEDNHGGQWIYVKAAETLTIHSLCHITNASVEAGTWLAEMSEASDIATGPKFLGVNQIAFASADYGWIWRGPGGGYGRGIKVRTENATKGALLHPLSGTAGALDDANVDEGVIAGLTAIATTTTLAAVECQATTIISCNLTEAD
jgi:hypothetical protein